jgi:hypothetical protein
VIAREPLSIRQKAFNDLGSLWCFERFGSVHLNRSAGRPEENYALDIPNLRL